MVIKSNTIINKEINIGNKAKNLISLKNVGFSVPKFIVLDSSIYEEIIQKYSINSVIRESLSELSYENIDNISNFIISLFDKINIDIDNIENLSSYIDYNKNYAIRSSGFLEDEENFSFAGLYETKLNIKTKKEIENSIISCYKSMFSTKVLSYILNNSIDFSRLNMSIIIQDMIIPDYSGVAFTVNAISGDDREIVIELVEGLGESLVNGSKTPKLYRYNWYNDKFFSNLENGFVDEKFLREIARECLIIQKFFGYPCDIEFLVKDENIYILQARSITKIKYLNLKEQWTTANFKDGGVSSKNCTMFMWSLYEYVWEKTLRKFVLKSKLLDEDECRDKLGNIYFGRPYWNLSFVKKAMSRVIGYNEKNFENSLGIGSNISDNNHITKINLKSIIKLSKVVLAQRKILKDRNKNADLYIKILLEKYENYKSNYKFVSDDEIEKIWYKLTKVDYMQSESIYFWQVFINTVNQAVNQYQLTKYISEKDYLKSISMIDNISHLKPFHYIWDISRKIRSDENAYRYWENESIDSINEKLQSKIHYLDKVLEFIDIYGYHSKKELDITYPCYDEDIDTVIQMFKDMVLIDDNNYPFNKYEDRVYEKTLEKIKTNLGDKKYEKLKNKIEDMRKLLWLREEFKDISTRFYYIVRIYTIKLADYYYKQGLIKSRQDIWHLKIADIWNYMDKKISSDKLKDIIQKNSDYYNGFRNYKAENEIGDFKKIKYNKSKNSSNICGLGCSSGVVKGRARLIEKFEDMKKLEKGDILVTKFTDTGWSTKLMSVSGIVTECGGILCHLSIVAREYGIPCIVAVDNLMSRIKDKSIITIDGETGQIWIEE